MTAPLPVLGLDPGHDGGAVLLAADGRRLLCAWGWRRRQRRAGAVYVLRESAGLAGARLELASLHEVGLRIRARYGHVAVALVVEGISLHRRAAPATAIELGRAVGLLTGPLLQGATVLPSPLASQWRPAILSLGSSASSDDSEAAAKGLCVAMGWEGVLGELASDGHAAEAACIARWGWAQQHSAAGRG